MVLVVSNDQEINFISSFELIINGVYHISIGVENIPIRVS